MAEDPFLAELRGEAPAEHQEDPFLAELRGGSAPAQPPPIPDPSPPPASISTDPLGIPPALARPPRTEAEKAIDQLDSANIFGLAASLGGVGARELPYYAQKLKDYGQWASDAATGQRVAAPDNMAIEGLSRVIGAVGDVYRKDDTALAITPQELRARQDEPLWDRARTEAESPLRQKMAQADAPKTSLGLFDREVIAGLTGIDMRSEDSLRADIGRGLKRGQVNDPRLGRASGKELRKIEEARASGEAVLRANLADEFKNYPAMAAVWTGNKLVEGGKGMLLSLLEGMKDVDDATRGVFHGKDENGNPITGEEIFRRWDKEKRNGLVEAFKILGGKEAEDWAFKALGFAIEAGESPWNVLGLGALSKGGKIAKSARSTALRSLATQEGALLGSAEEVINAVETVRKATQYGETIAARVAEKQQRLVTAFGDIPLLPGVVERPIARGLTAVGEALRSSEGLNKAGKALRIQTLMTPEQVALAEMGGFAREKQLVLEAAARREYEINRREINAARNIFDKAGVREADEILTSVYEQRGMDALRSKAAISAQGSWDDVVNRLDQAVNEGIITEGEATVAKRVRDRLEMLMDLEHRSRIMTQVLQEADWEYLTHAGTQEFRKFMREFMPRIRRDSDLYEGLFGGVKFTEQRGLRDMGIAEANQFARERVLQKAADMGISIDPATIPDMFHRDIATALYARELSSIKARTLSDLHMGMMQRFGVAVPEGAVPGKLLTGKTKALSAAEVSAFAGALARAKEASAKQGQAALVQFEDYYKGLGLGHEGKLLAAQAARTARRQASLMDGVYEASDLLETLIEQTRGKLTDKQIAAVDVSRRHLNSLRDRITGVEDSLGRAADRVVELADKSNDILSVLPIATPAQLAEAEKTAKLASVQEARALARRQEARQAGEMGREVGRAIEADPEMSPRLAAYRSAKSLGHGPSLVAEPVSELKSAADRMRSRIQLAKDKAGAYQMARIDAFMAEYDILQRSVSELKGLSSLGKMQSETLAKFEKRMELIRKEEQELIQELATTHAGVHESTHARLLRDISAAEKQAAEIKGTKRGAYTAVRKVTKGMRGLHKEAADEAALASSVEGALASRLGAVEHAIPAAEIGQLSEQADALRQHALGERVVARQEGAEAAAIGRKAREYIASEGAGYTAADVAQMERAWISTQEEIQRVNMRAFGQAFKWAGLQTEMKGIEGWLARQEFSDPKQMRAALDRINKLTDDLSGRALSWDAHQAELGYRIERRDAVASQAAAIMQEMEKQLLEGGKATRTVARMAKDLEKVTRKLTPEGKALYEQLGKEDAASFVDDLLMQSKAAAEDAVHVHDLPRDRWIVRGKDGAPYAVPREVADVVERLKAVTPKAESKALALYDAFSRWWIHWSLPVRPGFHFRNWLGNLVNGTLLAGDVGLAEHIDALRILASKDSARKYYIGNGLYMTGAEARQLAEKAGAMRTYFQGTLEQGKEAIDRALYGYKQSPLEAIASQLPFSPVHSGDNFAVKAGIATGDAIEQQARLALFLGKLRAGYSPEEAAMLVKKYLFNSGDLTQFERSTMSRIIPFWSWIKNNGSLQLETLLTQPGKIVSKDRFYDTLSAKGAPPDAAYNDRLREQALIKLTAMDDTGRALVSWRGGVDPTYDLSRFGESPASTLNPLIRAGASALGFQMPGSVTRQEGAMRESYGSMMPAAHADVVEALMPAAAADVYRLNPGSVFGEKANLMRGQLGAPAKFTPFSVLGYETALTRERTDVPEKLALSVYAGIPVREVDIAQTVVNKYKGLVVEYKRVKMDFVSSIKSGRVLPGFALEIARARLADLKKRAEEIAPLTKDSAIALRAEREKHEAEEEMRSLEKELDTSKSVVEFGR
jgi:hypothetical protein